MWQVQSINGKAPVNDQFPKAKAKSEGIIIAVKENQNRISIPRKIVHKIKQLASNLTDKNLNYCSV
jgi:hypothetical protein